MAEGFDRLKSQNWVRINRDFIGYAIDELNDAEFKLWVSLKGIAYDFQGKSIGQAGITLALIEKRFGWSQGKSSETLSGLIKKRFVKRIKRGHYYISQTFEEVQNPEHSDVRTDEHNVHSSEVYVRHNEQSSLTPQSFKDKESFTSSRSEKLTPDDQEKIWDEICKEDPDKAQKVYHENLQNR